MNENYPDREGLFIVGILYFTEIVTLGEFTQNPGARGCFGGNDRVGIAEEDLGKRGAVVKT
jgi:hypothetical protein